MILLANGKQVQPNLIYFHQIQPMMNIQPIRTLCHLMNLHHSQTILYLTWIQSYCSKLLRLPKLSHSHWLTNHFLHSIMIQHLSFRDTTRHIANDNLAPYFAIVMYLIFKRHSQTSALVLNLQIFMRLSHIPDGARQCKRKLIPF